MDSDESLVDAHRKIAHLSAGSSGNASVRTMKGGGTFLIKPSGIPYEDLKKHMMVEVSITGALVGNPLYKPSTDTASHALLYRTFPSLNAIVHTHSNHATAFAAIGADIPCVLTAIADVFGGPISCLPYADIGNDAIGRMVAKEMLEELKESNILIDHRITFIKKAYLLRNHGVLTLANDLATAVHMAIMVEDSAKTLTIAANLRPEKLNWVGLPPEAVAANYKRYSNLYGQTK
jgi:L-ribulose-5-phosphate 4-epimerase